MACGCEKGHGGRREHHGGSCRCGCGNQHGGSCSCGRRFHASPAFWTRSEKVAWLEKELEGLQEQVQALQERIAALKGEG